MCRKYLLLFLNQSETNLPPEVETNVVLPPETRFQHWIMSKMKRTWWQNFAQRAYGRSIRRRCGYGNASLPKSFPWNLIQKIKGEIQFENNVIISFPKGFYFTPTTVICEVFFWHVTGDVHLGGGKFLNSNSIQFNF